MAGHLQPELRLYAPGVGVALPGPEPGLAVVLARAADGFYRIHMGGCQNYGPFWGPLIIRCRIILRTQKGTIILTTTHMAVSVEIGGGPL